MGDSANLNAPADPRRTLAQHARTLQLLGVDFLPVRGGVEPEPAPSAQPASAAPVRTAPPPPLPTPSPRPATPAPTIPARTATRTPEPVRETEPTLPLVIEPKPGAIYARADQVEAQRLLDELRERYEREAPHQHFVTDHHTIVFGDGDPRARLMFVGEAPGAEEDKVGRPFVGRAGQLLDKMIQAMGLKRSDVYIANVLKTRPPNNATPTQDECARCAPYLLEQIAIVRPVALVTLGLPASRTLLNTMEPMAKLRGHWHPFTTPDFTGVGAHTVPVMPTYHPAFLLRAYTRENRQKVWSDLLQVATKLGLKPAQSSQTDSGGDDES